jgi:hypothetical protein
MFRYFLPFDAAEPVETHACCTFVLSGLLEFQFTNPPCGSGLEEFRVFG